MSNLQAVYFNQGAFLAAGIQKPEVDCLRFMYERVGASLAPPMDLTEVGDSVTILESTADDPLPALPDNRFRQRINQLEAQVSDMASQIHSLKRITQRLDELEAAL